MMARLCRRTEGHRRSFVLLFFFDIPLTFLFWKNTGHPDSHGYMREYGVLYLLHGGCCTAEEQTP